MDLMSLLVWLPAHIVDSVLLEVYKIVPRQRVQVHLRDAKMPVGIGAEPNSVIIQHGATKVKCATMGQKNLSKVGKMSLSTVKPHSSVKENVGGEPSCSCDATAASSSVLIPSRSSSEESHCMTLGLNDDEVCKCP